jgi:hypothetical protein
MMTAVNPYVAACGNTGDEGGSAQDSSVGDDEEHPVLQNRKEWKFSGDYLNSTRDL